jgi:hypothetical protein
MQMQKTIQRVELNDKYHISIYCPFCGAKVVDMDAQDNDGEMANPCPHTLFIAHDEGFEHRDGRFDANLNIVGVEDDDLSLPDKGIDGLTDCVTISDAVKFAAYVGPPSFFGSYVGFAPLDE